MKRTDQVMIREYTNTKQMNREVQKFNKQGWSIIDTQTVTTQADKAGCGCLLGLFSSRAKYTNKYIVRYEKKAA